MTDGPTQKLQRAQTWLFDLDNTLYPSGCRLFDQIDQKMGDFISRLLDVPHDEAKHIQKTYFYEHGTTLNGLMAMHGIDPNGFLDYVHDIDVSPVPPNPALADAIKALPGKAYIFTNGTVDHAQRVMDRLGISDAFVDIFDIHAASYVPKPSRAPYDKLVNRFGIDPHNAVMVEDIARNLVPASAMGMSTIWVPNDYEWAGPAAERFKEQSAEVTAAIDHTVDDLTRFLATLA